MSQPVVLNKDVVPLEYDVVITPNLTGLNNYRYDATVEITMELKSAWIQDITLHAKDIFIVNAKYTSQNGEEEFESKRISYDSEEVTACMSFFKKGADKTFALPKGMGKLFITYIGEHNNQMAGFYRSSYTDAKGQKKIMVSTQFEALDARRCLPCVDEPSAKAVFRATLIVDSHLTALSNMPEESVTVIDQGARKRIKFLPSPKMSSYLLAFAVGEFDFVQALTEHGVLIRVFTPPTKSHLGRFALEVGVKSLDLYDGMFGQPYPLPKLDMIAIPEFAMGAMENWGLVTYREVDVLIDDARASAEQKQRVASVVAHELAHQWFGNLVTMAWWDDLWLNEGFASWMQTHACDYIFPNWEMWTQFINDDQASALRLDALTSSHPIQVPINRAEEVEEVFDLISYCKGACVVRLIHAFLGAEDFKKGLQLYMTRHAYQNTKTMDLWNAWAEVSGKPVPEVMKSWTEQMGFPLLTVSEMNYISETDSYTMNISQEWFLSDGSKPPGHSDRLWKVPLLFATGTETSCIVKPGGLLETASMEVTIPLMSSSADAAKTRWCKVNGGQHLPVRVLYKSQNDINRLLAAIRSKQMSADDRCGMILDAYALARAGLVDPGYVLTLLAAYENEDSMAVWEALEMVIGGYAGLLRQIEGDQSLYKLFKPFVAKLVSKTAKAVGWDDKPSDGHLGKLLRAIMVRLQCTYMDEDPDVRKNAQSRYEAFLADPTGPSGAAALPADFKTPVFKLVLETADVASGQAQTRRAEMMKILAAADTTAEKKHVYLSIGSIPSEKLKISVLDWASTDILLQDFFYPFHSVAASGTEGAKVAWEYMLAHFGRLQAKIAKASPSLIMSIIGACAGGFCTESRANEIEQFFKEHPVPLASRKVSQIIENTLASAKFVQQIQSSQMFKDVLKA